MRGNAAISAGASLRDTAAIFDCFVRVRAVRPDGFVEFVFSIGEPELGAEMILPEAAFREFCVTNNVRFLTLAEAERVDADASKWRYGRPGLSD